MIDAILWVLQSASSADCHRRFRRASPGACNASWKALRGDFVALGFLFILNQDYWEETTESLTLVLSACVVCMAIGVPIGILGGP